MTWITFFEIVDIVYHILGAPFSLPALVLDACTYSLCQAKNALRAAGQRLLAHPHPAGVPPGVVCMLLGTLLEVMIDPLIDLSRKLWALNALVRSRGVYRYKRYLCYVGMEPAVRREYGGVVPWKELKPIIVPLDGVTFVIERGLERRTLITYYTRHPVAISHGNSDPQVFLVLPCGRAELLQSQRWNMGAEAHVWLTVPPLWEDADLELRVNGEELFRLHLVPGTE